MNRFDNGDRRLKIVVVTILVTLLGALGVVQAPLANAANCNGSSVGFAPLNDLGAGQYHGYTGGLYSGGSNTPPSAHASQGASLAENITPRNESGVPDPASGKIVFLSIGMSNTHLEFATFAERATSDAGRDPHVVVVNGAEPGADAKEIRDPKAGYWNYVANSLANAGVSAPQVQAVWLKEAVGHPQSTFPDDAIELQNDLKEIAKILKQRFPNLWLVYPSSRIYAGFATTTLNPEPYAYQGGFAIKWLIEDQIQGGLPVAASQYPWLSWGPYLWADGTHARSDGLQWLCSDFLTDGTHPSESGAGKVVDMLMDFVHSDPTARAWYENGGGPGSVPPLSGCLLPLPPILFRLISICLTPSTVEPTKVGRYAW